MIQAPTALPTNPMLQFNRPQMPQGQNAGDQLRQLFMLLGGLGGPTTNPLTPGISSPAPQPQPAGMMPSLMGGLGAR